VILTDPTEDDLGDDERLAFVFDRERLEASELACELVVPLNWRQQGVACPHRCQPGDPGCRCGPGARDGRLDSIAGTMRDQGLAVRAPLGRLVGARNVLGCYAAP
jgi:hypothetical protein